MRLHKDLVLGGLIQTGDRDGVGRGVSSAARAGQAESLVAVGAATAVANVEARDEPKWVSPNVL